MKTARVARPPRTKAQERSATRAAKARARQRKPPTRASKLAAVLAVTLITAVLWVLALLGAQATLSKLSSPADQWVMHASGELTIGAVVIAVLLSYLLATMANDLRARAPPQA